MIKNNRPPSEPWMPFHLPDPCSVEDLKTLRAGVRGFAEAMRSNLDNHLADFARRFVSDAQQGAGDIGARDSSGKIKILEPDRGISDARKVLSVLDDLDAGLAIFIRDFELDRLTTEIESREKAYALEAERVKNLRDAANRGTALPEGTGTAFGHELREHREDANAAFSRYETANVALIEDRKAIDELIQRLSKLQREAS